MKIGNLNVPGRVFCAPMAGVSTAEYRLLARRFGAAVVYTEMISSHGIIHDSQKTLALMAFQAEERPVAIQLFGADPVVMRQAAALVSDLGPDLIDLNLGCPVKKVVTRNGGAAILKDLGLARDLILAAVEGSRVPVTVKLRSGWDERSKVYIEAGQAAESAGAAAIALHARTRSGLYQGKADWEDIRRLKEAVAVPVIGNGDINSGEDARRMIDQTGCDAVMVGRAAMGNPWIFREINHFLETGTALPPPTPEEKAAVIREHARLLVLAHGEPRAMLIMRGVLSRYSRGWVGATELRRRMVRLETEADLTAILNRYLETNPPVTQAEQ
jgi:tRNA-dihydrouridine synthase B